MQQRTVGAASDYAHGDGLGSVRLVTTASGAASGTATYEPWGAPRAGSANLGGFGYTGELTDAETGFVYLRARYLDPGTGTFTTEDSFGGALESPMSQNRFAFAHGNPANYTDPSGHWPILPLPPIDLGPLVQQVKDLASNAFDALCWAYDEYQRDLVLQAFAAGNWITVKGEDGVERQIRTRVKEQPGLSRQAGRLGQDASDEINSLLRQFLNGNSNPGIGNRYLDDGVFYLRGRDGGRVFLRKVGDNAYEILGYADKGNEDAVIRLVLEIYGK